MVKQVALYHLDSVGIETIRQRYAEAYGLAREFLGPEDQTWYDVAHTEIQRIASAYRGSVLLPCARQREAVRRIAWMVAAISPQMPWGRNIAATVAVLEHGLHAGVQTRPNTLKALYVQRTGDESVFRPNTKTWAFGHNLAYPTTSHRVTLDVWMLRAAFPGMGLETCSQRAYPFVAATIQDIAASEGRLPLDIQQAIWRYVRDSGQYHLPGFDS